MDLMFVFMNALYFYSIIWIYAFIHKYSNGLIKYDDIRNARVILHHGVYDEIYTQSDMQENQSLVRKRTSIFINQENKSFLLEMFFSGERFRAIIALLFLKVSLQQGFLFLYFKIMF